MQLEVGESQVQQKSREQLGREISAVDRLQVNFDEAQRSGEVQVEFNNSENSGLHSANVIIVEGLSSHVGQLVQGDAANFLVLGGDEGRRDAEQLQVPSNNLLAGQDSIDNLHCEVQGLWGLVELVVQIN